MEGSLTANGQRLETRDAAHIIGDDAQPTLLDVRALEEGAHFMIIEMQKSS
jgi:hypothetical protein